ncbi:hypothetical protein HPB47_011268 [Ixodes persulcatus]|uniref:Uncharacterized protein n=1 Tax=Ixodes persulcatus TaxID=34615 RepID=A0AC60NWR7_IXOPE|nr:hypothetical protein HPB47_011268 [Ixodes persulcatus]
MASEIAKRDLGGHGLDVFRAAERTDLKAHNLKERRLALPGGLTASFTAHASARHRAPGPFRLIYAPSKVRAVGSHALDVSGRRVEGGFLFGLRERRPGSKFGHAARGRRPMKTSPPKDLRQGASWPRSSAIGSQPVSANERALTAAYVEERGRIASKRDPELESQILDWIEEVLEARLPQGPYEEVLRDGVVLCKVMNALQPGIIPKINTTGGQFKKMENIVMFQNAAKQWGVPEIDVFQTVDLWEKRNIPQVSQCILALGRACYLHPEYEGPCLGPKPAEINKREFTELQLRAGEGIINLQYGTNRGANASGMNFGNTRHM